MPWKKVIKGIAFVMIFLILFSGFTNLLSNSGDVRNRQRISGFYKEPENTLDAVYIGSSNCYAYWNPLVAWEQYGMTVYPFSANAMHFVATEYMIREARKTQPDAMFIVNTNTLGDDDLTVVKFHHLLDNMPLSLNKLQLTNYYSKITDLTWEESLELYIPLYRYHVRWSSFTLNDLYLAPDKFKGTSAYDTYMGSVLDLTETYAYSQERTELPDYIMEAVDSLLDYCEEENIKVLFVTAPRVESQERLRQLNTLNAILEERGFDTLNFLEQPELCGLDLTQDFYNKGHTNIHGSVKFTQYLAKYLTEHYGIADHRGDDAYAAWAASYGDYRETLHKSILDFEPDLRSRTLQIAAPADLNASVSGDTVELTWSPSEGADEYAVYRRQGSGTWEQIAVVAEPTFIDSTAEPDTAYTYRVVPCQTRDGQTLYGKFSVTGVKATLS